MTDISAKKLDKLGFVKRHITSEYFVMEKKVKNLDITVSFDFALFDRVYLQWSGNDSFRCHGVKTIDDIKNLYWLVTGEDFT